MLMETSWLRIFDPASGIKITYGKSQQIILTGKSAGNELWGLFGNIKIASACRKNF